MLQPSRLTSTKRGSASDSGREGATPNGPCSFPTPKHYRPPPQPPRPANLHSQLCPFIRVPSHGGYILVRDFYFGLTPSSLASLAHRITMASNIQTENNPAFARIPPWVRAKLRPIALEKIQQVHDWVENECIPAERIYKAQLAAGKSRWHTPAIIHELRQKAKAQGLWNLFLPNHFVESPGLTNLEYSCCAEIMGRVYWAAQVSTKDSVKYNTTCLTFCRP
jgi:hypothetical protein